MRPRRARPGHSGPGARAIPRDHPRAGIAASADVGGRGGEDGSADFSDLAAKRFERRDDILSAGRSCAHHEHYIVDRLRELADIAIVRRRAPVDDDEIKLARTPQELLA